jgi:hypothetical protein
MIVSTQWRTAFRSDAGPAALNSRAEPEIGAYVSFLTLFCNAHTPSETGIPGRGGYPKHYDHTMLTSPSFLERAMRPIDYQGMRPPEMTKPHHG